MLVGEVFIAVLNKQGNTYYVCVYYVHIMYVCIMIMYSVPDWYVVSVLYSLLQSTVLQ